MSQYKLSDKVLIEGNTWNDTFWGVSNNRGRNILGGIALGLPNFFSLYYLVKMLEAKAFESATLFTIHNIAIVIVSTFVGILFFKEKISLRNAFGIGLALFALYLVTY